MNQSDPGGDDRVPDEELAAIRRQLRDALGEQSAPLPRPQPRPRRQRPRGRGDGAPANAILRFVGGFVAPGLILVAILLVERAIG